MAGASSTSGGTCADPGGIGDQVPSLVEVARIVAGPYGPEQVPPLVEVARIVAGPLLSGASSTSGGTCTDPGGIGDQVPPVVELAPERVGKRVSPVVELIPPILAQ